MNKPPFEQEQPQISKIPKMPQSGHISIDVDILERDILTSIEKKHSLRKFDFKRTKPQRSIASSLVKSKTMTGLNKVGIDDYLNQIRQVSEMRHLPVRTTDYGRHIFKPESGMDEAFLKTKVKFPKNTNLQRQSLIRSYQGVKNHLSSINLTKSATDADVLRRQQEGGENMHLNSMPKLYNRRAKPQDRPVSSHVANHSRVARSEKLAKTSGKKIKSVSTVDSGASALVKQVQTGSDTRSTTSVKAKRVLNNFEVQRTVNGLSPAPGAPAYSVNFAGKLEIAECGLNSKAVYKRKTVELTCGLRYEGPIVSGKMQGQGRLILARRDDDLGRNCLFEGNFNKNEIEGKGAMWFKGGVKFEGIFKGGKANGKGSLIDSEKNVIVEGNWFMGQFDQKSFLD